MNGQISPEIVRKFRDICRRAGVKLTHQRLEVFREIAAARDHPTVERLYERLRARVPSLSMDTVYRALEMMSRHGVVEKIRLGEGPAHFDGNPDRHYHLVCSRCGRIADVRWPSFDGLQLPPDAESWGRVESRQVQLRGTCRECIGAGRGKRR